MDSRTACLEEDMVERVAKAIAREVCKTDIVPVLTSKVFHPIARAAIEAMREPTPAMLKKPLELYATTGMEWYRNTANRKAVWQQMIDAALTSRPKAGTP